jgi:hypothetical protein
MSPGKKTSSKTKKKHDKTRKSVPEIMVIRLLNLPRVVRILIVGVFALAVTLIVALVAFYESIFYSDTLQFILYVVATVLGLVMYVIGWYLIVGTVDTTPPVRQAVWWYVVLGTLAIVLIILSVIQAATIGAGAV